MEKAPARAFSYWDADAMIVKDRRISESKLTNLLSIINVKALVGLIVD